MKLHRIRTLTLAVLALAGLTAVTSRRSDAAPSFSSATARQATYSAYLPLVSDGTGGGASWPTVAGNPERTSWISDELVGNPHVVWYRPIDAYIPPNFQVIAANNLVYISSARGLYALRYDTGDVVWRYDTELPLGNSPTIASVNGMSMAFVGGYDKKIHAFNALNGTPIWEFSNAEAGYDSNPLVINDTVYVGNRDGYFYALKAESGALLWQYPSAGQDPIGPIHLSPAYSRGVIYFATDYNYAYALNTDGTLKWKSQKLPGDGYGNYWPVVYTDPSTQSDYVVFSGKIPYREFMRPGTLSVNSDRSYNMYGGGMAVSYPKTVTVSQPWASGKTVLDYSAVSQYLQSKPWLKTYTVLDGVTGLEAPVVIPAFPMGRPQSQVPPVVSGDLLFLTNDRGNGRDHIMGWKFGTNYFADTGLDGAGDEPVLLSGGGNNIYDVLCFSRAAWSVSLADLFNVATYWPYGGNSLGKVAPGYDQQIYYGDPANPLDNISGVYGNLNGVYDYGGQQNPLVPYHGNLYTIKGNALIALGTSSPTGKLPLLSSNPAVQTVAVLTDQDLISRLSTEIRKVVSAGVLKPGYTDDSQFGARYSLMDNYFDNPGDTLITLSMAYPYLSVSDQAALKNYLKNTVFARYFQNDLVRRIGWKDGLQRDSIAYPPDLAADMRTLGDNYTAQFDGSLTWNYPLYINANPNNLYGMWKYAALVSPEDTQAIYQRAVSILTAGSCQWSDCSVVPPGASDAYLIQYPYQLNAYIAGYQGFVNLYVLAGKPSSEVHLNTKVSAELARLIALRVKDFSKDNPFAGNPTSHEAYYGLNFMSLSRNFTWMTPELATILRNGDLAVVQSAVDEYNRVGSYWFVSKFGAALGESGQENLYDYSAIFQARAYILNQPRSELAKWLDVPAFERGDLFYIQNLMAVIKAPKAVT